MSRTELTHTAPQDLNGMGPESGGAGRKVMAAVIPMPEIWNLEDNNMHHAKHYLASLLLISALAAPISMMAVPLPETHNVQVRVYDREHRDYHNWDDREDHAWGVYLTTNHRKHYEYRK